MLVLSRRLKEGLVFPQLGIRVEVVRLSNAHVRLGIKAPPHVRVLREELQDNDPTPALLQSDQNLDIDFNKLSPLLRKRVEAALEWLASAHDSLEVKNSEQVEFRMLQAINELRSLAVGIDDPLSFQKQEHKKKRIQTALVVDDNPNESKLLASFLRLKNIEVELAEDGAYALEKLEQKAHDIVLLDMNMPRFDGRWTVRKIRSDSRLKDIQIFAVSGYAPEEFDVEIGPTGCNQWFTKPLNPHELVEQMVGQESNPVATSRN